MGAACARSVIALPQQRCVKADVGTGCRLLLKLTVWLEKLLFLLEIIISMCIVPRNIYCTYVPLYQLFLPSGHTTFSFSAAVFCFLKS